PNPFATSLFWLPSLFFRLPVHSEYIVSKTPFIYRCLSRTVAKPFIPMSSCGITITAESSDPRQATICWEQKAMRCRSGSHLLPIHRVFSGPHRVQAETYEARITRLVR